MAHRAPPHIPGAVRGRTPRQLTCLERRRKASFGLELGQPLERLLRERVVLFFAVVRLRTVARLGEAFAEAVAFARLRAGVPFPLPFERERAFCSLACCRCWSCVRSFFASAMTFPSGSPNGSWTTSPPASTGSLALVPPGRSAV